MNPNTEQRNVTSGSSGQVFHTPEELIGSPDSATKHEALALAALSVSAEVTSRGSIDFLLPAGDRFVHTPELHTPIEFLDLSTPQEMALFISLRDCLTLERRLMLTAYTAENYVEEGIDLFLSSNLGGGYGLKSDGEIVSVFSLPGFGLGRLIIEDAINRGGDMVSCFDIASKLPSLYEQFGFQESNRVPWNDDLAPKQWNREAIGCPDVIRMKRTQPPEASFPYSRGNVL